MPRYTEEQIARANETDLVSFLRARGEKLKKSGKEYRWMKHDSLTVNYNEWYRFSGSKGGHPIDFLMEFYNMSFSEAVKTLINELPGEDKQEVKKMEQEDAGIHEGCPIPLEKVKLQLPKAYENNDRVREYLIKERKISEKIIDQMLAEGKIYEDAVKHNVIFIGYDPKGTVRYAGIRGTKEKYRGDAPGSEKAYGFSHTGTDDTLFVFEAPIDLLSFLSATGDGWETHHYISLGGVSEKALIQYLADHKKIRKIFLCLDNDTAGNAACEKLAEKIPDDKMVMRLRPVKKDWNECLTAGIDRKDMEEETSTGRKSNPSHKNVRCGRKSSAVVMVSIYPIWESNFDPGKSGKRKNMACNGTLCILYSREKTSKCSSNRAIQCLLSNRRGRCRRYDQAKTCKMWSRYDESPFYQ